MIYPDDLPLVQLIKLYRSMPTEIVITEPFHDTMKDSNHDVVVGLNMEKLVNPIADEFTVIEADLVANPAAPIDLGTDWDDWLDFCDTRCDWSVQ